jgi:hypothetical protein
MATRRKIMLLNNQKDYDEVASRSSGVTRSDAQKEAERKL